MLPYHEMDMGSCSNGRADPLWVQQSVSGELMAIVGAQVYFNMLLVPVVALALWPCSLRPRLG